MVMAQTQQKRRQSMELLFYLHKGFKTLSLQQTVNYQALQLTY